MMIVGFTGTRAGMTSAQKATVASYLETLDPKTVHHGDCLGADADFHGLARDAGFYVVGHPCDLPEQRAFCNLDECRKVLRPLVRNENIVNSSEFMIACPKSNEELRGSGTWATIRCCRKKFHPLDIVWPDGAVTLENWSL